MAIDNPPSNPWYRERWPWLLMIGPASVVVAGAVTAWLAVASSDGLVEDDYYKQGLAINQILKRDQVAAERDYSAQVTLSSGNDRIRLFLKGAADAPLPPSLRLRLSHPTRAGNDQNIELEARGPGFFEGRLTPPPAGRWLVIVEDPAKSWRLTGTWQAPAQQVSLRARPAAG